MSRGRCGVRDGREIAGGQAGHNLQGVSVIDLAQDDIRKIIHEADLRGIRVVPEFDLPGHSASWFVSHPELASAPGPYSIETHFGVFGPTFDPTNEATYTFLDRLL